MACSLRLPLGLEDGSRTAPLRLPARLGLTARQARHCAASSPGATATVRARHADERQQTLATNDAPASQGFQGSAAQQQQVQQVQQVGQAVSSLPGEALWGHPKVRRHLRRRQVERPAPEAMIQAAAAKQRERQQQARSEQGSAATAADAHEGQRLQHVQAAAQHVRAGGHELRAAAADAPADTAAVSQRAEQAALGGKVAAGVQHQLASLEQLSQRQLANLAQAAQHAKQQLAASLPARQQASGRRLQQQQLKQAVQQQGAQPGGAQQATAAAAARRHLSGVHSAASRAAHAVSAQVQQQVIGLQQAGQQLQARLWHKQSADRRQQQTAAPSRPPQQQQAAAPQQQRAAALSQPARNVAAARHAVAVQPAAPPPSKQAQSHASMGRFVVAWVLGASASALLLLRWLRTQRRKARVAQEAIRNAEQRARAAKLYDRQRQRFQRALLAAEDLEGADSSVFTAVSRKGATNGSPGTQNARSDAGGGAAEGAGGNPFMRGLPGGAAAAALAGGDVEEEEEEDSNADVFDSASWDDDVRRQWESFVSSSKVNKGKLWDTTQVDEGLPEVWVDLNR